MGTYWVYEGHMGALKKKVAAIHRKCAKYGCGFRFSETGASEIRDVADPELINPLTGKPVVYKLRFVEVEAEGVAIVNGWELIASVEHTSAGNIYSKVRGDVEIPLRYRDSAPFCEHCHSDRHRKSTFIVRNVETGEFKQVGKSCLTDFTHGMSASFAAYLASLRSIFEEIEEDIPSCSGGWHTPMYDVEEILRYAAETIRHFGYVKSGDADSTRSRAELFFDVSHGWTRFMPYEEVGRIENLMCSIGFDPESAEAVEMTNAALAWLAEQGADTDYMHNLKTVVALGAADRRRFGLLVSLFPTYDRDLEVQAQRKAEAEAGKGSEYVGAEGDRVSVEVESCKLLTSWESSFGYRPTTVYLWKIVGKDGNVYTWKTQNWLDVDRPPVSVKGTVKAHKEFRGVKQTELTRCKTA